MAQKYFVLTVLNPNAINKRAGRPSHDCDVARVADPLNDFVMAESFEAAFDIACHAEIGSWGYPERLFRGVIKA